MGREIIGSVTDWDPGGETDMAYEMAICFLAAALGQPPSGVTIEQVTQDHDLGFYPSLAVCWEDGLGEPCDFIKRSEDALAEFNEAVDWNRIHPSRFWSHAEDD